MIYFKDELLPLSGLQHFSFCRRQWALIHLEGQWAENLRTTEGHLFHERAHDSRQRMSFFFDSVLAAHRWMPSILCFLFFIRF